MEEETKEEPIEIEEEQKLSDEEVSIEVGDVKVSATGHTPVQLADLILLLLQQKEIRDYLRVYELKKITGASYCE